jgi:hypothetical protein
VETLEAVKWMLLFLINVFSLGKLLLKDFTFLQFLSLTSDEVSYLSSILHSSEHVVPLEGFLKFILVDFVNLVMIEGSLEEVFHLLSFFNFSWIL